jgi:nucleoid-associated protein YgaU
VLLLLLLLLTACVLLTAAGLRCINARAQAEVYSQQTESKVHELELGGLVEYVPTAAADADADAAAAGDGGGSGAQAGHATFVVVGSMGSHYVVKLNDVKRSCTCMDHR